MKRSQSGGAFGGILVALLVGGVIGAGACYYWLNRANFAAPRDVAATPPERNAPSHAPAPVDEDTIARKLREWNLTPDELKRDLGNAGNIVREKGRDLGQKVAGATSDVAIIARIKTKFALDQHLQALKITVGSRKGHVTLSGTVASPDLIGRAIVLALDTADVVDVVSSIKVQRKPEPV